MGKRSRKSIPRGSHVCYLVDGYNLLFSLIDEETGLSDMQEVWLKKLVLFADRYAAHILIIFDAQNNAQYAWQGEQRFSRSRHVELIYPATNQSADQWIIDRLTLPSRQTKTLCVVSSDMAIVRSAHSLRIQTVSVLEFAQLVEGSINVSLSNPSHGRGSLEGRRITAELIRYEKIFEERLRRLDSEPE